MRYTWLFGENLGQTSNNNSWYFFEHIVERAQKDGIDAFFIISKSKKNIDLFKKSKESIKNKIIWRNSIKHQKLYWRADMFFVTLSYKDILPDIYQGKHKNLQPLVYLQHGTTGIKKIEYDGEMYWNSLLSFVSYAPKERKILREYNNFADYQLPLATAHPRHKELVRMNDRVKHKRQILWFLTWRDYIKQGMVSQSDFAHKIKEVLTDNRLQAYLKDKNQTLRVVLHQQFDVRSYDDILESLPKNIDLVHANEIDVMYEIASSRMLITDYSSVGFDFAFLGKTVLTYQFDYIIYGTHRDFYCDLSKDFTNNNYRNKVDLIDAIVSESYDRHNKFFSEMVDTRNVNFSDIRKGLHIDSLYDHFKGLQRNKVSIIGYNFYGRGGTVTATKSLAEGLAERGYIVELISLKRINIESIFPKGVIVRSFMNPWRSVTETLKHRLFKSGKHMGYLSADVNHNLLIPYVGFALRRFLGNTKSRIVISTRESMHLFLSDTKNKNIKDKLYFFHTTPDIVEALYPGVIPNIQDRGIEKALFVTDNTRKDYKAKLGFDNYINYAITGNALSSTDIINEEAIVSPGVKEIYRGIVLTRVSKDRAKDINNIIDFGLYMKANGIDNIKIDVFGSGDYVYELCDKIMDSGLEDTIFYKGMTTTPYEEIRNRDFLVDFSEAHSFGMIYIEAILNGVPCFARSNSGAIEVLSGVQGSVYNSHQELGDLLKDISKLSRETLINNHKTINKKFGRNRVVDNIEKILS